MIDMNIIDLQEDYAPVKFEILESKPSEVDGVNVLAKVRGTGFIVEGASQNNRFYSKLLWETAIARTKELVASRGMFGYLGHSTSNTDDNIKECALIITKIEMPNSESSNKHDGLIEYIIPATDAGKALNALLRAGSRLSVSSRATGESKGKDKNGNDILCAESYSLLGWDIVRFCGVKNATPTLIEALKDEKKDTHMTIALDKYTQLLEEKVSLAKDNELLKTESKKSQESVEAVTEMKTSLAAYEALGSLADVGALITVAEKYTAIGSLESLVAERADFEAATTALEAYEAVGSLDAIEKCLEIAEQYTECLTIDEATSFAEDKNKDTHESEVQQFAEDNSIDESLAQRVMKHADFDATIAASVLDLLSPEQQESESKTEYKKKSQHESVAVSYKDILGL